MKAPPFAYVRAASLADAFELWSEAGPEAKLLAGGQSLLATLAFRLSEPCTLIDIIAGARARRHLDGRRHGPGRRADHPRRARRQRAGAPARAAAGRGGAADRPSRHPQPRHHRRLAGLRRSRRRAAGLLRGAGGRRSSRAAPRASGASRPRSSSPGSTPRRSAENELIAAVEFPAAQAGRAQRDPRAGAPLRRLRHGRHRGAGEGRRQPARRTRSLVFFGVGDRPVSATGAMAALAGKPVDARDDRRGAGARSMPISTRPPISTAAPR